MKQKILKALEAHFVGHIEKHKMNVEIMLANPLAIHDHTDLMSSIEKEIQQKFEPILANHNENFINEK